MNRSSWKFTYNADKLLDAASAKKSFHEGRLAWWKDKRKEVEATIRSEGIEIDESVAAGSLSGYSGIMAQTPQARPEVRAYLGGG